MPCHFLERTHSGAGLKIPYKSTFLPVSRKESLSIGTQAAISSVGMQHWLPRSKVWLLLLQEAAAKIKVPCQNKTRLRLRLEGKKDITTQKRSKMDKRELQILLRWAGKHVYSLPSLQQQEKTIGQARQSEPTLQMSRWQKAHKIIEF